MQLLKEAKEKRENITLIWLDLANAYGSVPHELVALAFKKYYVPDYTTNWQSLEKAIITGCTVSVIVFIAAVTIIIKRAEKECRVRN